MIAAWLLGVGLIVVSDDVFPPVGTYVVIVVACVLLGSAVGAFGVDPRGLKDHRQ